MIRKGLYARGKAAGFVIAPSVHIGGRYELDVGNSKELTHKLLSARTRTDYAEPHAVACSVHPARGKHDA
jgi:hypothetical protein